jgi:hypothetical protein
MVRAACVGIGALNVDLFPKKYVEPVVAVLRAPT